MPSPMSPAMGNKTTLSPAFFFTSPRIFEMMSCCASVVKSGLFVCIGFKNSLSKSPEDNLTDKKIPIKKYDILLVNFPYSNLKLSKLRPALVIVPLEGENTILCQITTKKRGITKYEVLLNKNDCQGEIKFNSNIYLDMIFTLHESLVIKKIGLIKEEKVIKEIEAKIKGIFS